MQNYQTCYFNTPSTQCTARTPEKDFTSNPFQKEHSDINQNNSSDSKGMKNMVTQKILKQQPVHLIPSQNISSENYNYYNDSLKNIQENLKLITEQCQQKSIELNLEKERSLDVENKLSQLQQNYQLLEEELIKYKQICKQIENFSKELENKLQNQFNTTLSNPSQKDQNLENIIMQKEQEIQELKLLFEQEKDQASNEQDRLMKEFQIIFEQQKSLNQKMLQENIQLQKAIRSNQSNSKISSKSQSKLLDEQQLRTILEDYYSINNEECLQQIPVDQYLSAIKILKEISLSVNSKQHQEIHPKKQVKQEKITNTSHLRELKDKQEQLKAEIQKQMDKFIEQKNTQQQDIIKFKNETDQLKRQLDQVENLIQEMEQNPKQKPLRNSCVSFENNNFE